jgi:glycosyltransferase involved in cell wall biosynthesis
MPKTIIVIPTYNEAGNLPVMAEAVFALGVEGLEVLTVDDNSPDGTGQVADQLQQQYPGRFHVIHRPGKQGLGTAYIQGPITSSRWMRIFPTRPEISRACWRQSGRAMWS